MPVTPDAVQHESTLSDAFLRQLMAVGQVDVLVGLPTLDNAATIIDVVRAIHLCFTRDFPRLRTVMINSDGGSTDGTPELIRAASFTRSGYGADVAFAADAPSGRGAIPRPAGQAHGAPHDIRGGRADPGQSARDRRSERSRNEPRARDRAHHADCPRRGRVPGAPLSAASPRWRARHPAGPSPRARPLRRRARRAAWRRVLVLRTLCVALPRAGHLEPRGRRGSRSISGCAPRPSPQACRSVRSGARHDHAPASGRRCARPCSRSCCPWSRAFARTTRSGWRPTASTRAAHVGTRPAGDPDPPSWDHAALAEQARHDILEIRALLEGVLDPAVLARVIDGHVGPAFRARRRALGRDRLRVCRRRAARIDRHRAPGWDVRAALLVAGVRVHGAHGARGRLRRCRRDSIRSVRRSNG